MQRAALAAQWISIAAFLFYGPDCLFSSNMKSEFERYGLARFRMLTGALEFAGALGLLAGFYISPLLLLSSAGLAALMLLGVGARLRIHDPLPATIPAFVLFCLNGLVFANAWRTAPLSR
jgi:hypothetical protein